MDNTNNNGVFPVGGTDNKRRLLDLVFVHGLGGDAYSTWTRNEDDTLFWPKWLADDFKDIGVWTVGYGATASRWVEDEMPMEDRGLNLLNHLSLKGIGKRPLVFVTHSMGGLITKQILDQSDRSNKSEYKLIAENCTGVAFIAVPHDGSGLADILDYARVFIRGNKIVEQLQKDDVSLRKLANSFGQYAQRTSLRCISFYETKEVRVRKRSWKSLWLKPPVGMKIVSESSASGNFVQDPPLPLDDDHISICKLGSRDAQLYGNILGFIEKHMSTGPVTHGSPPEDQKIQVAKLPHTNSRLFGREKELSMLDQAWQGNKTNIVILEAMGGTGKTALLKTWLDQLAVDNYRGANAVYTWSFYSQGSAEDKQGSADEFFDAALGWFSYQGDPIPSAHEKGIKLAELINGQRTLLILDGLEPLQYPVGTLHGELKDQGLKSLVLQLAASNQGLCLISSRQAVVEVKGKPLVIAHDLEQLQTTDGVKLLKSMGVDGSDSELKKAVTEVVGHALALNLLGNYVKTVFKGDIRQRDKIPALSESKQDGEHAQKVMAVYETHLAGSTALSILYLMGLFDRPVSQKAIQHLRDAKIAGLTDKLGNDADWHYALDELREQHLLNSENPEYPGTLDTHPLVREYFGKQLAEQYPDAWQQAHRQLYEYFKAVPEKEQPDTLSEMEPLFAAIAHGCAAGLHQEAVDEVYWPRVRWKQDNYICKQLGAYGADLSAVAYFFELHWNTPAAGLPNTYTAAILNWAGFCLRALGRLQEAVQPMQAALDTGIEQKNWKGAAMDASNLSELQLVRGDVPNALKIGEQSVQLADQSGDAFERLVERATLANAQHQAGELVAARASLAEAEKLQQEWQPDHPQLYSLHGFQYCDLLLTAGESWDVQQRARRTLKYQHEGWYSLLAIALDKLSLGRASLQQAIAGTMQDNQSVGWISAVSSTAIAPDVMLLKVDGASLSTLRDNAEFKKTLQTAGDWLYQAVEGLRKAGGEEFIARGLLARTSYYRCCLAFDIQPDLTSPDPKFLTQAQQDLQEAHDIARRGGMRLFLCDYHLESARLALTVNKSVHELSANEHVAMARQLIEETGYKRRLPELVYLEEQLVT